MQFNKSDFTVSCVVTLPILFMMGVFFNISINEAQTNYNNWRIEQLILYLIIFIVFLIINAYKSIYIPKETYNQIIKLYIFSLPFLLFNMYVAINWQLSFIDHVFIFSLLLAAIIFTTLLNLSKSNYVELLFAILSLLPVYIVMWCVFGLFLYYMGDIPLVWHGAFVNIRYYDDALLPCLFILWCQPSFLKKYPNLIFIIGTLYLFTLWLDGARAVVLSIFLALILAYLSYRPLNKFYLYGIKKIVLSYLISFLFFLFYYFSTLDLKKTTVFRTSSSKRIDIWLDSWQQFLQQPLSGVGGSNFIFAPLTKKYSLGHPHNIIVQLVLEWGILGITLILFIAYTFYKVIYKNRFNLPFILYVGLIAIIIDSMLSGIYVYPHTQLLLLLYLSYCGYKLKKSKDNSIYKPVKSYGIKNKAVSYLTSALLIQIIIVLYLCIIPQTNKKDNYDRIEVSIGPRLWSDAKSVQLHN